MSSIKASVYDFFSRGRTLVPEKHRNKAVIYIAIATACFLDNVNVSGSLSSLLSIQQRFNSDYTTVSWVVSAYALTLSGFIMLFGRIGDIIGHHIVFLCGIWAFCLLSLICAVIEKDIIALLVFRAFQGVAGSASVPSAYGLIINYYSGPQLTKAVSGLTLILTGAIGVGSIIGGAFSESDLGYKGVYYVSFALSFIAAIVAFFFIVPLPKHENVGDIKDLNYAGAIFIVFGFILVVLGLTEGGVKWDSPKCYVPLPIGILLVVAVILFERFLVHPYQLQHHHSADPTSLPDELSGVTDENKPSEIVNCQLTSSNVSQAAISNEPPTKNTWLLNMNLLLPAQVWGIPNFIVLVSASFMIYANFFGGVILMVQYNTFVQGNSPIISAVKIIPFTVTLVLGSSIYRDDIADRISKKWVAVFGVTIALGGNILFSRLDYTTPNNYWKFMFPGQVLFGYGCNLFFLLYLNLIIINTPLHLQGIVTGICQSFGQVGTAISFAATTSMLGELSLDGNKHELQTRFTHAFYLLIAICAVNLILAALIKDIKLEFDNTMEKIVEVAPGEVDESLSGTNEVV